MVASAFVVSALAGLFIAGDRTTASGDLIIPNGTTYVIQDLSQYVDGNVEVMSGGTLKVIDGTLSVISNFDQRFTVTVDGGTLMLDHGVLTTHLDQINPWAELELTVINGGTVVATNGSELRFPGGITLTDESKMVLRDSTITALDEGLVAQYVVGSSGLITLDSANDGPEMDLTDSTLQLYDSTIDSMPEYPADMLPAGNLTLNGASALLSVNSHISVDFGPAFDVVDWRVHNVLVANDLSKAYLYGTTFDEYVGALADRAPAVIVSGVTTSPAVPNPPAAPGDTTVGEDVDALAAVDSWAYVVEAGETMEMETWDVGTLLDATDISSASIVVRYSVDPTYDGATFLQWKRETAVPWEETPIQPQATDPPGTTATYDLPIATIDTVGELRNMDVRFVNGATTGSVQFESLWVVFSAGGEAYVYRWLNATVGDEYGVPIPNATIDAVFTGATDLEGQEAFYYTVDGVSLTPDSDVLDYMGEDTASYKTTKENGEAVIPYLTDIIVSDGSANSRFVGSYAFTGTADIDGIYSSTESYSLPAYPAMDLGDQSGDLTVEISGVSVPSPDSSRWLVVPLMTGEESFTIENMIFYHAGDVIVASDGELIVRNVEFILVQNVPNERTIYVDGNGHLIFEDCHIDSELPIDIVVQGHGTLEVLDSDMHGVSIVAKEDATVILDGTDTYNGDLTTSYNSRAIISIYDCNITSEPVLSGSAVGGFTNTSVPSIAVEGDAVALIYRWIHVSILDGNAKPLPGVDVFAYTLIPPQELWTSAVSDAMGVARLNCLGTTLTSSGPSYAGAYSVNATYVYGGTPYDSEQQIDVGVMPYTEPLGRNATYATLTISAALPDLTIAQTGAISSDPESPLNGQETTITALVRNIGISVAYDVQVDFFDNDLQFASVIVPSIAPHPTDATEVQATWVADEPLYPTAHSIRVEVDPDDLINELDDSEAFGYGSVMVQNLPDLYASPDFEMYSNPPEPVVDSQCTLVARIYNIGDNHAYNVPVAFYNATIDLVGPANLIGEYTISSVSPGGYIDTSVLWIPENIGDQTITVLVNENHTVPEISYANNNASFEVTVYNYPDLALSDFEFGGPSTVASGQTVTVSATLVNLEMAPVTDPVVGLFIDGEKVNEKYIDGTFVSGSGTGVIEFEIVAPFVADTTDFVVMLSANPDRLFEEQSWLNNNVSGVMTVSDIRPDLQVTDAGISVTYDGENITGQMWGRTVAIAIEVENLGASSVSGVVLEWGIRTASDEINYTHEESLPEMGPGNLTVVPLEWKINLSTPGDYVIWALVDPGDEVNESGEANNFADIAFEVEELDVDVTVTTFKDDYEAGTSVVADVEVLYTDDGAPVVGLPLTLRLFESAGVPIGDLPLSRTTNDDGKVEGVPLLIPEDLTTGQYYVGVDIQGADYSSPTFTITGEGGAEGIPLLIWLIVIAVIIAVVVGFTAYTYVYGLGKLVECGECGAFIPAASKRCPKCGVEFEAGTMKCSECGAWVPSSASECPNCGVKFVGEPGEGELDYLDKMRSEYEAMASEYREMAKADLGKKYSEKRFEEWWRAQPTYVSFDDWLAKEEAKRKEGPVPCPVCGTLNPREATVCHKCGTIFAREGGEPPGEMPPEELPFAEEEPMPEERAPPAQRRPPEGGAGAVAAQKKVVRRPIDRKVVPKKIIRTPAEKDDESR